MDTILILSGKGGAGKTTIARELGVAGSLAGHRVALVDLDPQVGLTGWYGRRAQDTPLLVAMPRDYDLAELASAGIDELMSPALILGLPALRRIAGAAAGSPEANGFALRIGVQSGNDRAEA